MKEDKKESKKKADDAPPPARTGIPKDWICPNILMPLQIKYSDMDSRIKDYSVLLTQYVYTQMYRKEIKHFKDAAKYVKECFEEQEGGTWNVVCGINFGSFFCFESRHCILLYWSSIGFLIWKYG